MKPQLGRTAISNSANPLNNLSWVFTATQALLFEACLDSCFTKCYFTCCDCNLCSFGKGRADAEKFLGALQDVYCLERVRIMGDDLRLLKCYPGSWQVTALPSVTERHGC